MKGQRLARVRVVPGLIVGDTLTNMLWSCLVELGVTTQDFWKPEIVFVFREPERSRYPPDAWVVWVVGGDPAVIKSRRLFRHSPTTEKASGPYLPPQAIAAQNVVILDYSILPPRMVRVKTADEVLALDQSAQDRLRRILTVSG